MEVIETKCYKKDLKKAQKQGRDTDTLLDVLEKLIMKIPLDAKYKDHQLKGELKEYRECHIEPDCLLVYMKKGNKLYLAGLGSHSELFK